MWLTDKKCIGPKFELSAKRKHLLQLYRSFMTKSWLAWPN